MAKNKKALNIGELIETTMVPIGEIKENPNNPRVIKDKQFLKLVKSVTEDSWMLKLRPLVVDKDMVVLGGNMRLKACIQAGFIELPIVKDTDLTKEQKDKFIIKDNLSYGLWNWEQLNEWDTEKLEEWGLELETEKEENHEQGEEIFSEYLGEANNYVVLMFDNDIDWLSAQSHFKLNAVYSKRQNGKKWSKGIGRVIDGADYLKELKDESK